MSLIVSTYTHREKIDIAGRARIVKERTDGQTYRQMDQLENRLTNLLTNEDVLLRHNTLLGEYGQSQ